MHWQITRKIQKDFIMKILLPAVIFISSTLFVFSPHTASANESDCTQSECNEEIKQLTTFAKNGSPHAMAMLGVFYFHGEGVEQDYKKAAKWLQWANKKDSAQARYYLSLMYRQGLHFEQDIEKADWHLTRSSEGGFVFAIVDKGIEHYLAAQASSSSEEYVQAYQYFEQAAALNSIKASYLLAKMTELGIGSTANKAKARELYAKAASKNYRDSKSHLERLSDGIIHTTEIVQTGNKQDSKNEIIFPDSGIERIEVAGNKITMATHLKFIISDIQNQKIYNGNSGSRMMGQACDKWATPPCRSNVQKSDHELARERRAKSN